MTDAPAINANPPPGLSIRWIRANILGGLAICATPIALYMLGNAISARALTLWSAQLNIFFAVTVTLVTLSYLYWANLAAGVLARKLPGFRRGKWLALFTLFGLVVAIATAFTLYVPEVPAKQDWEFFTVAVIGTAFLGGVVGAAIGGLQALTLRHAARGLGAWIGCSALSCMLWAVPVVAEIYGPAPGLTKGFFLNGVTFLTLMTASLIMLPAMHRLAPR